jgi:hypothetical protein
MPMLADGLHDQLNIALAVEGAGVADVAVVVDYVHDVGGLAPANPLEVNTERAGRVVLADVPVCVTVVTCSG